MSCIDSKKFYCDNCGKAVPWQSTLDIVTQKCDDNPWSRLHVNIIHAHGFDNDSKHEPANLCKKCAMILLTDAVERIKKGERASEGTEEVDMMKW